MTCFLRWSDSDAGVTISGLSLPLMFSMEWATVELFALDSMIVIFTL
ncbi:MULTISPECIES: hypothetical protein [Caldilinea]|jgi:hypothetical protein|nr:MULTISPECIES: hypothetical protein [Caldilinea]MBO9392404.1 hypothetical protein [Caldilinea sp.]